MENNLHTGDFELFLKDKTEQFRMHPSKRVWHSIYNDLHPGSKWPSVAVSMLLIIVLLMVSYLNTGDNFSEVRIADNQDLKTKVNSNAVNIKNYNAAPKLNNNKPGTNPAAVTNKLNATAADQLDVTNLVSDKSIPGSNIQSNGDNNLNAVPGSNEGNRINNNLSNSNKQETNNVIAEMNEYINTNRLFNDINTLKNKKSTNISDPSGNQIFEKENLENTGINNTTNVPKATAAVVPLINIKSNKKPVAITDQAVKKTDLNNMDNPNSTDEKSWIEDYAFHNKTARKKWKDRVTLELYATPSVGYRKLVNNVTPEPVVSSFTATTPVSQNVNKSVTHKPSIGLEAGIGIAYNFSKKLRFKTGIQFNYTNYNVKADEINHPVLTTLLMNDLNSRNSYLMPRLSLHSNSTGLNPVTLHNRTYQLSIPLGLSVKLAGNDKLEWFAGASIQPTLLLGGNANLISSDYQSYVKDNKMISTWNLNSGFETYINYKLGDYNLQLGPQFRYQILSTYNSTYSIKENLYNTGIKFGIIKGF